MALLVLLLVLSFGSGHGSTLMRPLWYHSHTRTWQDARAYCTSAHRRDLLTALSRTELDLIDLSLYHAWIGLGRGTDHYHWAQSSSSEGDTPGHFHWDDLGDSPAPQEWTPCPGRDCGLSTYGSQSPSCSECGHEHFFFCSGAFSDVFVNRTLGYADARVHCALGGRNLSTFPGKTTLHFPGSPVYQLQEFPVWIGLHSSSSGGTWVWADGQSSDFRNWAAGSQSKSMSVHNCSDAFPFLCYNPSLVLLQENLTWEQAEGRCKTLSSSSSFRLLSAGQSHMEDTKNVLRFAQTDKVWVGLRFLAGSWFWLDGSAGTLLSCPGLSLGCGALVLHSGREPELKATDCSERLNLLCHEET